MAFDRYDNQAHDRQSPERGGRLHAIALLGMASTRVDDYLAFWVAMDRKSYERVEDEAKARNVGLWRDPQPVPPWEWRRAPK